MDFLTGIEWLEISRRRKYPMHLVFSENLPIKNYRHGETVMIFVSRVTAAQNRPEVFNENFYLKINICSKLYSRVYFGLQCKIGGRLTVEDFLNNKHSHDQSTRVNT